MRNEYEKINIDISYISIETTTRRKETFEVHLLIK